ncbi:MAG: zinc-dependent metalloprotease, partial [Planctomycetales bacterium]|nr:zinc-dependent metalloprotease [Planctomycetales bacterium]
MSRIRLLTTYFTCLVVILLATCQSVAWADDEDSGESASSPSSDSDSKYPPFDKLLPEKDRKEFRDEDGGGLMKLYMKDDRLFAEISHGIMNQDLLMLISISQGIGQSPLVAGMSWGFEDDGLYQFRQVGDRIQLIRRNVRFKANANTPEAEAVDLAYTDSVLFSLPIATKSPSGSPIVELTPIFKSDLPQISQVLRGYSFSSPKSSFKDPKVYPTNVEISVAATYQSSSSSTFDTVPDARGLSIGIHYSISKLPKTSYQPRLADDRVGYFVTAIKDFSKNGADDRFVRYINRWDLGKKEVPDAEMSPPEKPIIFYLEKTVPHKYRKPITDGIKEWNRAFEKAGWIDAVRVIQQTEADKWSPEDVRYNTFRWITAGAGFAMGPSRVNPLTGQILDADIIFDADFIEYWKDEYETFTPESVAALTGGPLDITGYQESLRGVPHLGHRAHMCRCEFNHGMSRELAFGATSLLGHFDAPQAGKLTEQMIMQGLKEVTMHEVGHTLGLRHNFKSSTIYTLDQLNSKEGAEAKALTGSVMDYAPANIRPEGQPQGNFFSTTIGPYDMWAIE